MLRPVDSASASASRDAAAGGRRALVLGGTALLIGLALAHPSTSRMLTWPWVLGVAALWLLPTIALLLRLAGRAPLHLPAGLLVAGLGVLALGTVAAAWLSPFSAASSARVWPTLGGVAFYIWLHDWLTDRPGRTTRLAGAIAIAGALVMGVSVVVWCRLAWPSPWSVRNAVPFGHSNYTAGAAVLLLPWLVHAAWDGRGVRRLVWSCAVGAALLALAGTSSRGGVLALVGVVGCASAVIVVRARWSRWRKISLVAALAAIGAAAVLANPRLRELLLRRGWGDAAQESNRQRTAMLAAGWRLGLERPLLGWGPGTVPLAYPRVRAALDGGVDNVLQLHNTPLQIWATLGLVGVVASVLLVGGAVTAVRRTWARSDGGHVSAALASLGGYAVVSLTDHQLDVPLFAALVAANLALLTHAAGAGRAWPSSRRRRAFVAALALIASAPAFALVQELRARRAYDVALTAIETGRVAESLAALDEASRRTPHDPYFQHQAVGVLLGERDQTDDPRRRAEFAHAAVARLESSLATGSHEEFAHFNLGWLQLDLGDFAAAARHFTAAAHLVPDKGGVYFGLGLALQSAGRPADAIRAFALERVSDPRSVTSPAWEIPALAALRPAVHREAQRLYGELQRVEPRAATAAAWARWWQGEAVRDDELGRGFTGEAAALVAALPAIRARGPVDAAGPWAHLYREWRAARFTSAVTRDAAFGAALARRAARQGDDFAAFLRTGTEDESALIQSFHRARTGYGVLALHPDGPQLADAYIVQENRLVAEFAAGLFPPKGWLPGRFLLALLPPDPR